MNNFHKLLTGKTKVLCWVSNDIDESEDDPVQIIKFDKILNTYIDVNGDYWFYATPVGGEL